MAASHTHTPAAPAATGALSELTALMTAEDPYAADGRDDHAALRLAAANERFTTQRGHIRALDLRAKELGIDGFADRAELVPLLFAHSVYKSYPESLIAKGRWTQMSAWLDSITAGDVTAVDVADCTDIDDWLARLEQAGLHVLVSSGTSGKNSFLVMDDHDIAFGGITSVNVLGYPHRIPRDHSHPIILLGPGNARMRYCYGHKAMAAAYGRPGAVHSLTEQPLLVADMLAQTAIRRAMADGTATPGQIQAYQAQQRARSQQMATDLEALISTVLGYRHEPQILLGPWAIAWRILQAGHAAGLTDNAFHPDTLINIAGGRKGLDLPEDYEHQMDRFLGAVRRQKLYAMTEQSCAAPLCEHRRYHWPKGLELFILDETGQHLQPIDPQGRVTGRVGFYDPLWSGRWGGLITGDHATANYTPCGCGRPGPTIDDTITRYSDHSPGGDDKLTCGGSIEQYIRGIEPLPQ